MSNQKLSHIPQLMNQIVTWIWPSKYLGSMEMFSAKRMLLGRNQNYINKIKSSHWWKILFFKNRPNSSSISKVVKFFFESAHF